jgi:hypothetical protein
MTVTKSINPTVKEKSMAQKIKIYVDDHDFNVDELTAIKLMAHSFPEKDFRINDDPTNLKIYVGPYYVETHRYWMSSDGSVSLVEKDMSDYLGDTDDSDWQPTTMTEAFAELEGRNVTVETETSDSNISHRTP